MIRTIIAVAAVCLGAAAADAKDWDLKRYENKDGRFSVGYPEKPRKDDGKKYATAAGEITIYTQASTPDDNVTFAVSYLDYPPAFAKLDANDVLKAVRDGAKTKSANLLADGALATALSDNGIGHPGREFIYDHGKYLTKTRSYLVGTRLYQVSVTGSKERVYSKTAENFLLSFEVLR